MKTTVKKKNSTTEAKDSLNVAVAPSRASTRKKKSTVATVKEDLPAQTSKQKAKTNNLKKDQPSTSAVTPAEMISKTETSTGVKKAPPRKKAVSTAVATIGESLSTLTVTEKAKTNNLKKDQPSTSAVVPAKRKSKVETPNTTTNAPARKKSATNIVTTATEGLSTLTSKVKAKRNISKKELPSESAVKSVKNISTKATKESSTKSNVIENSKPFKRRNSNIKEPDEKSTEKAGNVKKTTSRTKKSPDNVNKKSRTNDTSNQKSKTKATNKPIKISSSLFKKPVDNSVSIPVQKKDTTEKQKTDSKRKSTITSTNQSKKMKQDCKTSNKENSNNSPIVIDDSSDDDDDTEDFSPFDSDTGASSWSTCDFDDDDDDFCSGPCCYPTKSNEDGAKRGEANSNKNNDGAGSGNNSTGTGGSSSVSKCVNLCMDSCGELWKEISIDFVKENEEIVEEIFEKIDEEIEHGTGDEINLTLNTDNSFNLSTEHFEFFSDMEENSDSVFISQSSSSDNKKISSLALNNESDDNISVNSGINETVNDDRENEMEIEIENTNKIEEEEQMKNNNKKICENLKFKTKFYNSIDSRYVLVHLKDTIILQGTIRLKLITGSIEIFGYKPKINEQLEIFSPRGYSNLLINPIKNSSENCCVDVDVIKDLSSIIKNSEILNEFNENLLSNNIEDILKNFNVYEDALILLERNDRKEIEMINNYMKENMFLDITNILQKRSLNSSEIILKCILSCENNKEKKEHANNDDNDDEDYDYDDDENDKIKISKKWNNIEIKSNSKIMIIGGKNVGKSTLLRYLINKNLKNYKSFLLIDIDIGQSEIFIPQTISVTLINKPLLGPGYLYSLKPLKSYLYGDTNIVQSPIYYLLIVKKLINYCYNISNNNYNNIPWLINTMGYNKGFGSELTSIIIEYLKPTDVIQIEDKYKLINNYDYHMSSNIIKNIPKYLFADEILKNNKIYEKLSNDHQNNHNYRLILLDSIVPNINKKNVIKLKNHNNNVPEITARDKRYEMMIAHCGRILNEKNDEWLTDVQPYIVPIDKLNIISLEDKFVSKTDLLYVINGNFVYLCGDADADGCFECFGLGIVRAVNNIENTILILPSTTEEILKCFVTTLVECKIPLQASVLLNQGAKVQDIAPYIYTTKNFIATRHIHPIYYRPNIKKLA